MAEILLSQPMLLIGAGIVLIVIGWVQESERSELRRMAENFYRLVDPLRWEKLMEVVKVDEHRDEVADAKERPAAPSLPPPDSVRVGSAFPFRARTASR